MRNHFGFRLCHNAHSHCITKEASDGRFLQSCPISNLLKSDVSSSGDHIRDLVMADGIDANQVRDLERHIS